MGAPDVLARLAALGVRLNRDGDSLIAEPRSALTDEARAMIRAHKAELLATLQAGIGLPTVPAFDSAIEPSPSPLVGLECNGCANLEMRDEWHTGTRRRFWWRCRKGYELLEARRYGERVTISPPECQDFEQWKAGQQ